MIGARIAFIPARGGSKRIPRKNLKTFLGRPVIAWPLEACMQSSLFDRIIVSTDDLEITEYVISLGVEVFPRSAMLAGDYASTTEVIKELINIRTTGIHDEDWIYQLYPTSAISSDLVTDFVHACESSGHKFLVGVSEFRHPIQRALVSSSDESLAFVNSDHAKTRTQDLTPHFFDAGKIYGGLAKNWRRTASPLLDSPGGYVLPRWAAVDLDYPEDWEFAEAVSKLPRVKADS